MRVDESTLSKKKPATFKNPNVACCKMAKRVFSFITFFAFPWKEMLDGWISCFVSSESQRCLNVSFYLLDIAKLTCEIRLSVLPASLYNYNSESVALFLMGEVRERDVERDLIERERQRNDDTGRMLFFHTVNCIISLLDAGKTIKVIKLRIFCVS